MTEVEQRTNEAALIEQASRFKRAMGLVGISVDEPMSIIMSSVMNRIMAKGDDFSIRDIGEIEAFMAQLEAKQPQVHPVPTPPESGAPPE
tara:strand:- start:8590 stop:8859 length:270 start_codon:yes stop_codon:yes gene_type:complete